MEVDLFMLVVLGTAITAAVSSSPNLYRTVRKNGFHRELFTKIFIPTSLIDAKCECLIEEQFPPGLYIDPYELKNYREKGGPQFDSPAVDIEKPKELSPNLVFIIYPQQFTAIGPEYVTNVTVPVHIRYHQPSSRYDTVQIQLKNPRLYLLCQVIDKSIQMNKKQFPCNSVDNNCLWTEIKYKTDVINIEFDVPVGSLHHQGSVISVTLAVTLACCLYLSSKMLHTDRKSVV